MSPGDLFLYVIAVIGGLLAAPVVVFLAFCVLALLCGVIAIGIVLLAEKMKWL